MSPLLEAFQDPPVVVNHSVPSTLFFWSSIQLILLCVMVDCVFAFSVYQIPQDLDRICSFINFSQPWKFFDVQQKVNLYLLNLQQRQERELVRKWKVEISDTDKDEGEGVKNEEGGAREGSLDFFSAGIRACQEGSNINRVVH